MLCHLEFAKVVKEADITTHLWTSNNGYAVFPHNYMEIYESLELSQFDMFKEEVPKCYCTKYNLIILKWHRLMDGELLYLTYRAIERR
jgi:hypothetical protein